MIARLSASLNSNRADAVRFLKFLVVGAIGAAVDFGTLYLLHPVLGMPIVPANTISFTAAVLSNFTWNRYWTYPDSRSKPIRTQLLQGVGESLGGSRGGRGIFFLSVLISLSLSLSKGSLDGEMQFVSM